MNQLYEKIRIIHEPSQKEPFVVIDKPRGLPSAPLAEGDACALDFVLSLYPEASLVKGRKEIECGLVHRIDTETRGLLLIATSQDFYDSVISEQTNGRFYKTYEAACNQLKMAETVEGFPKLDENLEEVVNCIINSTNESSFNLTVTSRFRPYGLKNGQVRPVNYLAGKAAEKKAGTKEYSTEIELTRTSDGYKARCRIKEGYRHQVRCHLAWLGFPIKGDPLYNPLSKETDSFCFDASSLSFLGFSLSL